MPATRSNLTAGSWLNRWESWGSSSTGREMERSREIVTRFRNAIERIADVLVEKAIIEGEEVRQIIRETSR